MALAVLGIVISTILIGITLITIINVLTMYRLSQVSASATADMGSVSVMIPARNEAAVIAETVRHLLAQDYPNYELILLDDNSTDGTSEIAQSVAQSDVRFRIIQGAPLPQGWNGKNWACHQLSQAATGEWLIFTDADVTWQPNALRAVLTQATQTRADLLTVWATQRTVTWGERLVVPLMAFVILGYLPHWAVNRLRSPAFAAANGQCMVFRAEPYHTIGGHQAVRAQIVEDITLAKRIKSGGYLLRMTDGAGLVTCRMYENWLMVRNGYAKNIIAGYGGSLWGLLAGTLFHWLVFLFPFAWLVASLQTQNTLHILWALSLISLGVLVRMLTAITTKQRPQDALLLPVSVLLMTLIAAQAVYWRFKHGGVIWKDRAIIHNKMETATDE